MALRTYNDTILIDWTLPFKYTDKNAQSKLCENQVSITDHSPTWIQCRQQGQIMLLGYFVFTMWLASYQKQ